MHEQKKFYFIFIIKKRKETHACVSTIKKKHMDCELCIMCFNCVYIIKVKNSKLVNSKYFDYNVLFSTLISTSFPFHLK